MKSLLWILNSAFAGILCTVCLALWVFRPQSIPRKSLQPAAVAAVSEHQPLASVDLVRIYERDPFGTMGVPKPVKTPDEPPLAIPAVPVAPQMRRAVSPAPVVPNFLPPLGIALKGVMHSVYEQDNRAIIADKKSKQEQIYKVGDSVLDAEIIRIEPNQVMFMRSNGQQEIIFITPSEALSDPIYARIDGLRKPVSPVKKITPQEYLIDPHLFQLHVTNLAQFIDALDITTVVEEYKSIGCRVGSMAPYSIGVLLGLQVGDVIISINAIQTATTAQRLSIYQQILALHEGDTIQVKIQREGSKDSLLFVYTLQSFATTPARKTQALVQPGGSKGSASPPASRINPAEKLHKDNKNAMLIQGGKPATLRSIKP